MNKVYGYDTNIYETSIGNIKNMNEEINCVYSSNGVTTMSTKQYNNYIEIINNLKKENQQLKENYDRIYNENCKLREEHNITDISLLDENHKLKTKR